MGRFVKHVTPDAWQGSYDLAAPHGKFCGVVAQMQLKKSLHFICEQPSGSDLYYEHPRPAVLNHPNVYQQRYDRCVAGLKAQYGPHEGIFIKKASTMTASNKILREPFEEFQCRGNHAHLPMHGESQNLSACQVWTWDEANRVAYGIHRPKKVQLAYPSARVQANPERKNDTPRGRDPIAPVNESSVLVVNTEEHALIQSIVGSSAHAVIPMMNLLSGNALVADNARTKVTMLTLISQVSIEWQLRRSAKVRQDADTNPVIHAEMQLMMSLHIYILQICQILHPHVGHHPVEIDNHYQVVRHPHEALVRFNEFAARAKISK